MSGGRTATENPRNALPGCESWRSTELVPHAPNTSRRVMASMLKAACKSANTKTRITLNERRSRSSHPKSASLAVETTPAMSSGRHQVNRERAPHHARRPRLKLTKVGRACPSDPTGSGACRPLLSADTERQQFMSTPATATAAGFFVQLMPLLADRTLMVIVSKVDDQHLTVSVVPKRMKDSETSALFTPLCCTGTAEELDRDLPSHLQEFVAGQVTLSNNLAQIQREREEAEKAAREELKKKQKTVGNGGAKGKTPEGKPLEEEKVAPPPAQPPMMSLFDAPAETSNTGTTNNNGGEQ